VRELVGERSDGGEGSGVNQAGAVRSENAGMSNEIPVRIRDTEKPIGFLSYVVRLRVRRS